MSFSYLFVFNKKVSTHSEFFYFNRIKTLEIFHKIIVAVDLSALHHMKVQAASPCPHAAHLPATEWQRAETNKGLLKGLINKYCTYSF